MSVFCPKNCKKCRLGVDNGPGLRYNNRRRREQHPGTPHGVCGRSSSGRAPPCQGGGSEFEPRRPLHLCGSLAQLGEHLPYKQRVTGSSPVTSTCISFWCRNAGVAELADAQDLKSCCSDTVPVRFRSPAFIERALDKSVIIDEKKLIEYVCVAQLDRALGYGPRCREFESSRARMLNSLKFLKNQGFKAIFVYADFMNPF